MVGFSIRIVIKSSKSQSLMKHPTYKTLISYIEKQLPEARRTAVEQHLVQPCQQCYKDIARLSAILNVLAQDRTSTPPEAVLRRAMAAFRRRPPASPQPGLRKLAILLFDNRLQPSPAAARGVVRTRKLLFGTEKVDVDLQITSEEGNHKLNGQVLGPDQPGGQSPAFVSLSSQAGKLDRAAETDRHGRFAFRQVLSGVYELVIDLDDQEIAITNLELVDD
jgi:hypothetical protein